MGEHIENAAHEIHKFSFRPIVNDKKEIIEQKEMEQSHSKISIHRKLTEDVSEGGDYADDAVQSQNDWNVGVIMKVHPDHDGKCCDVRKTWTSKVLNSEIRFHAGFRCWGPYRSDYNLLMDINFINAHPLLLLSTGAGCGFMIDFYNYFTSENITLTQKVEYYFSTESIPLFQWFTNITCSKSIHNFRCNAHLTVKKKKIVNDVTD